MEELQDVRLVAQFKQRCDFGMPERAVGLHHEPPQFITRDLRRRNVQREDFDREVHKRKILPVRSPVLGQLWDVLWNVKTTIWCQTSEYSLSVKGSKLFFRPKHHVQTSSNESKSSPLLVEKYFMVRE